MTIKISRDEIDNDFNDLLDNHSSSLADIINKQFISVKDKTFGAKGDGVTDDTIAIQTVLNYAILNKKNIFIPCGTYKITQTLYCTDGTSSDLNGSIDLPIIIGESSKETIFSYASLNNSPCLIFKSIKGNILQNYIKGIKFVGNNTTWAIEMQCSCGYRALQCNFDNNLYGIVFHNKYLGDFTELSVIQQSNFRIKCLHAVYYKVTSGDKSFHGSGLDDCYINAASNNSIVIIGSGSYPYNAPLDFTAWIAYSTSINPIVDNQSGKVCSFFGQLKFETFSIPANNYIPICTTGKMIIVGSLQSFQWKFKNGTCMFCSSLFSNDARSHGTRMPFSLPPIPISNISTILFNIPDDLGSSSTYIVNILIRTSNLELNRTFLISVPSDTVPYQTYVVPTLIASQSFNISSGYATTDFEFAFDSSNNFVLTNNNWTSGGNQLRVYVDVTPLADNSFGYI